MASGEICTIDDSYVLLYKIINWWNDSLPADDTLLCENFLRCQSGGGVKIRYNALTKELHLTSDGKLEKLISIFKRCQSCVGPKYLESIWLNKKIFDQETARSQTTTSQVINRFHFTNISPLTAKWFKEREQSISVQVEGRIGGLLLEDGRIALHRKGKFLKSCPVSKSLVDVNNIRVILLNRETGEELVKYQIVEGR